MSVFSRAIIEKALLKITNMEHIFSAKSLKQGQLPVYPSWLPVYPSIISKCSPRIFVKFPVCFPMFGAVMSP